MCDKDRFSLPQLQVVESAWVGHQDLVCSYLESMEVYSACPSVNTNKRTNVFVILHTTGTGLMAFI